MADTLGAGERIERAGDNARRSDWLDVATRFGLVAYGFVYLMIAWVAAQLALGRHSGRPSAQGALAQLAHGTLGRVVLWAVAAGLFLLVLWRVLEAVGGHRGAEGTDLWRKRALSLGKAVLYGALGFSALRIALGGGGGGSSRAPREATAKLMDLPAGQWLVGLVGLAIVAYGAALVWRGWTDGFLEHLDGAGRTGEEGRVYTWFGRIGHVAKGIAFGMVGLLVGYAALTHEPRKSGGLDRALTRLLHEPFGPYLLFAVAAGIGCYALFCFAWARHRTR